MPSAPPSKPSAPAVPKQEWLTWQQACSGGHWMAADDLIKRIALAGVNTGSNPLAWSYETLFLTEL